MTRSTPPSDATIGESHGDETDATCSSDPRPPSLVTDGGDAEATRDDERSGDLGDQDTEQRRKRRAAVRPHESNIDDDQRPDGTNEESRSDQWAPAGVDPDDVPWYFSPVSIEEPDPSPLVDRLGTVGIYLALTALGLAVVGVGATAIGIQPIGNAAITLSLGLGLVAMLLGLVFQAAASTFLPRSE